MQLIVKNRIIEEDLFHILENVQSQLSNGKLSTFRISGNNIQVTCPFHSDGMENRPSCFIYLGEDNADYGTFHCFTCGQKGSFAKFIGGCFDQSEYWGEEWLINNYSVGYADLSDSIQLEEIKLNKKEDIKYLDESILNKFDSYHPYMTKRKLTDDVIKKFQIKYDKDTESIVFPVRARNGKLVGLTRRSVKGKSFHIDSNFNKSNIYAIDQIKNCDTAVVVESQINCLTLWSWGYPSICLFGAGTTRDQIKELNNTDVSKWILAYDPDDAGRKGASRFKQYIRKDVFVEDLILPKGKDINDLSKEEFESILSREESKEWLL